uniref:Small-conductance mechanosensitive channel n=1 Tax=Candidatus Kentrum sp. DK TaxID=2126562 RepID=A0A450SCN1_9GAMM|nr:MAG: Small-conductance mechanosensitive channel [Candidatus Kentron sp. DK]
MDTILPYLKNLSEYTLWGNTLENYLWALLIFLGVIFFSRVVAKTLLKKIDALARKTQTTLDERVTNTLNRFSAFIYWLIALRVATLSLQLEEILDKLLSGLLLVAIAVFAVKVVQILIDFGLKKKDPEKGQGIPPGVKLVLNLVVWVVAGIFVLDNLGFEVKTLVTSLGIGGIAVALASQNIFSDLFSSFTIYLDKPFNIGDFIVLGNDAGVVLKIGLKTTRIRLLRGEELVISNQELTSSRVQNFKKMQERRITFQVGVEYGTPSEKMRKIPDKVRKIMEDMGDKVRFDRCHFATFGDFSLIFDIVYYVHSPDYVEYMNAQQAINFEIKSHLESEGVNIAFPTQTVFVKST